MLSQSKLTVGDQQHATGIELFKLRIEWRSQKSERPKRKLEEKHKKNHQNNPKKSSKELEINCLDTH